MSIFTTIIKQVQIHRNPVEYWRKQGAIIGTGCEIHTDASLGTEPYLIRIGDNVRINENVRIFTHDGGVWVVRNLKEKYKNADVFKRVTIGNNVHIGSNAIIMPGVSVGDNCIIGVGAIVTKDVMENSVAVGIPARVVESISEYIEKNKEHYINSKQLNSKDKKKIILEMNI